MLAVAGYQDGKLYVDFDFVYYYSSSLMEILQDTLPGQNGSPVFDEEGYVYGMYTCERTSAEKNYTLRITSWLIQEMYDCN